MRKKCKGDDGRKVAGKGGGGQVIQIVGGKDFGVVQLVLDYRTMEQGKGILRWSD